MVEYLPPRTPRAQRANEHDELTEKIIGAGIEVHRILGPGLLESIYEEALAVELKLRGVSCQRQVEVDVVYKNHVIKGQRLDLLVAGEVIVETKSLAKLPDVAVAQVISYLKATRLKRGLLFNFGCSRMADGIKRISL
jgi:GxxExxY protein